MAQSNANVIESKTFCCEGNLAHTLTAKNVEKWLNSFTKKEIISMQSWHEEDKGTRKIYTIIYFRKT